MIPHKYTAEEIIAAFERPANSSKRTNAKERKNPDQEEIRHAFSRKDITHIGSKRTDGVR